MPEREVLEDRLRQEFLRQAPHFDFGGSLPIRVSALIRRRQSLRQMSRALAVVAVAAVIAGVAIPLAALRSSPIHRPIGPTTGPCAAEPPGCGTPFGTASALAAGTWSSFPAGPLSPRGGQGSVWTGHEFVIWGGAVANGSPLGDGAAYNPDTGGWTRLPPSPLAPRYPEVSVWAGTEAIFWGGNTNTRQTFNDGAAYHPATQRWTRISPSPLSPRDNATGLWTGDSLIIFGGDVPQSTTVLSDGAVYHPDTDSWDRLPSLPLPTNDSVAATTMGWAGTELVVVVTYKNVKQSGSSSETTVSQRAFAWTPGSSAWRNLRPPPPGQSIFGAHPTWDGDELLLVGGTGCLPQESCAAALTGYAYAYNPDSDTWTPLPPNVVLVDSLPEVWTGRALVALNAGAMIGGSSAAILSPGDGAVYDPVTNVWLSLPRNPLANLDSASVAWTGKQLLVWASGNVGDVMAGEMLSSSPTTSSSSTTSPSSTTSSSSTAPLTTTTTAACRAVQLSASSSPGSGAGGHLAIVTVFLNTSTTTCTLDGYPTAWFVNGAGVQIGPTSIQEAGVPAPTLITLRPGDQASTTIWYDNPGVPYPPCPTTRAAGIRLFLPGQSASLTANIPTTICTSPYPQLGTTPVVPGTSQSGL
jgi:hypothetical protein